MFAALSAEQFASVEDVANDPTPAAVARFVESYAAAMGIHASRVIIMLGALRLGSERMQAEAEQTTFELRKLAPLIEDVSRVMFSEPPKANPRAPIPDRIRRSAGRDRGWQPWMGRRPR